ncbi:MAG: DUF1992 domain-containing protein [Verrucomicrobiae bacterium]|nr:DUF1992 domain-containing protein [Verrucomicrobiae bacterium]
MSGWNPPIESSIAEWAKEAEASGESLEGAGCPIDLSDYFATPESLRVGYDLLKSNGFCPAEVALLREIRELEDRIAARGSGGGSGADDVTRWRRELTEALTRLGLSVTRR